MTPPPTYTSLATPFLPPLPLLLWWQTVEKLPYTALRREFRDGIDDLKELVFLKVRPACTASILVFSYRPFRQALAFKYVSCVSTLAPMSCGIDSSSEDPVLPSRHGAHPLGPSPHLCQCHQQRRGAQHWRRVGGGVTGRVPRMCLRGVCCSEAPCAARPGDPFAVHGHLGSSTLAHPPPPPFPTPPPRPLQAAMTDALNEFKAGVAGECGPANLPMNVEDLEAVFARKRAAAVASYNKRAVGCVALCRCPVPGSHTMHPLVCCCCCCCGGVCVSEHKAASAFFLGL
jgi:hypothetical protein